jgi:hypothetical protein
MANYVQQNFSPMDRLFRGAPVGLSTSTSLNKEQPSATCSDKFRQSPCITYGGAIGRETSSAHSFFGSQQNGSCTKN